MGVREVRISAKATAFVTASACAACLLAPIAPGGSAGPAYSAGPASSAGQPDPAGRPAAAPVQRHQLGAAQLGDERPAAAPPDPVAPRVTSLPIAGPAGAGRLRVTRTGTAPFSAIGVTWSAAAPGNWSRPVAIQARVLARASWQPWRTLAPGAAEPVRPGRALAGTELAWTGPADGIDVIVRFRPGWGPAAQLAVALIDPIALVSDATVGLRTARGNRPNWPIPHIVRRRAWGGGRPPGVRAAPGASAGASASASAGSGSASNRATAGIVLLEAGIATDYAQSDVPRLLRALYHYETALLGRPDLEYAVVVDRFGRLWQGRAGALSRAGGGPPADRWPAGDAVLALLGGVRGGPVPAGVVDAISRYAAWRLSPRHGAATGRAVLEAALGTLIRGVPGPADPAGRPAAIDPVVAATRDRVAALLGQLPATRRAGPRLVFWRPSTGSWWLPGSTEPGLAGSPGDLPAAADYDGDGALDLATWTPRTGTWRYAGSAGGRPVEVKLGAVGDIPVPADYDGDGTAEPATWTPATGVWRIGWTATRVESIRWGRAGDVPVPADYGGDGAADPAVWRPGEGRWYLRGIGVIRLGSPWHRAVPADYDGDGAADPACWSPASHRWYIRGLAPIEFGGAGDVPVPGQYDGDGLADLAVLHAQGNRLMWRAPGVPDRPADTDGSIPVPIP